MGDLLALPLRLALPGLSAESEGSPFLPSLQPVRGGFARLQRSLAELRALPAEGAFQPKGAAVVQAVKDGLQQFKQFSRQSSAGASQDSSLVEVRGGWEVGSVPGSRAGPEVPRGLRGAVASVHVQLKGEKREESLACRSLRQLAAGPPWDRPVADHGGLQGKRAAVGMVLGRPASQGPRSTWGPGVCREGPLPPPTPFSQAEVVIATF